MKIQNSLVSNILNRPQRYFAHVTTVTLSWRVQNIVVISRKHFTLECLEFSSNFEFDRNMLSGTGARSGTSFTDEFSVEIKIFDELCFHFILIQRNYYKLMLMPWLLNFCAIMWKVCRKFFYYYYNEIWYFNQNWIKIENHMWHGLPGRPRKYNWFNAQIL